MGADLGPQTPPRSSAAAQHGPPVMAAASDAMAARLRSGPGRRPGGGLRAGPTPRGDPRGRRERDGQDHHHGEAGGALPARGTERGPGRGRHVPARPRSSSFRLWGDASGRAGRGPAARRRPPAVAFDAVAAAMRAEPRSSSSTPPGGSGRGAPMAELAKIRARHRATAPGQPRHVLLVLDATTGQNGLSPAESFRPDAGVTGVALTKLDGTAKGGVAVAIADRFGLPIVFAGVWRRARRPHAIQRGRLRRLVAGTMSGQ